MNEAPEDLYRWARNADALRAKAEADGRWSIAECYRRCARNMRRKAAQLALFDVESVEAA